MIRSLTIVLALFAACFAADGAYAQRQLPDMEARFDNRDPAFAPESGPQIVLSTTNSDYVRRGSMDPFAALARTDGFRVARQSGDLVSALKPETRILIIANPFLSSFRDFPAMTPPSAFSDSEIEAVRAWVENGGSLLILADHAPFGGGSSKLAEAFGFQYLNGHAAETRAADAGYAHVVIDFTPQYGLATDHPIANGDTGRAPIKRFAAFGGQAFIPADGARQLLTIPQGWSAIFTYRLEAELASAPRIDASGMSQGATLDYGKGRIALFGEAGGFTAQVIDGIEKFGFNTAEGSDNPEFILATLRWLARFDPRH